MEIPMKQGAELEATSGLLIVFAAWIFNGFLNPVILKFGAPAFWVSDIVIYLILPIAVMAHLLKTGEVSAARCGLNTMNLKRGDLIGFSIFLSIILFVVYKVTFVLATYGFGVWAPYFSYSQAMATEGWLRILAVLYLSLTAGIMESLFVIALPWLVWSRNKALGSKRFLFCVVMAVVFGAMHWEQGIPGLVAATVFGFVTCTIYLKTGDLWPIVFSHIAIDIAFFG